MVAHGVYVKLEDQLRAQQLPSDGIAGYCAGFLFANHGLKWRSSELQFLGQCQALSTGCGERENYLLNGPFGFICRLTSRLLSGEFDYN